MSERMQAKSLHNDILKSPQFQDAIKTFFDEHLEMVTRRPKNFSTTLRNEFMETHEDYKNISKPQFHYQLTKYTISMNPTDEPLLTTRELNIRRKEAVKDYLRQNRDNMTFMSKKLKEQWVDVNDYLVEHDMPVISYPYYVYNKPLLIAQIEKETKCSSPIVRDALLTTRQRLLGEKPPQDTSAQK